MRATHYHINTLKEAPAEAETASHQLMTRAGMIRKLAGGIYTYMPLGLRVIRKIEAIVHAEMQAAGAIELLMPIVQPAELWQASGRWQQYGPELLRLKDRHQRDFLLAPTSEEVITDIARHEIHSWRQLPLTFYHIQTKFRDERRPRFGLMRGREFMMKDAYSFDRDVASAQHRYQIMFDAYQRIFTRLGLAFRAVAADTGSIGGNHSHEFQVIAATGEDSLVYNPQTQYAANMELAEATTLIATRGKASQSLKATPTPGASTCTEVAKLLGISLEKTVKSIVLATDPEPGQVEIWLLLLRGDHTLNEIKAAKIPGLSKGFRFATEAEIIMHFDCKPGYLGPIMSREEPAGISTWETVLATGQVSAPVSQEKSATASPKKSIHVIADRTVANMHDFVCGANQLDYHYVGVNWGRDLPEPEHIVDLRNVVAGDPAPDGNGTLHIQRGIEVGHVFYLGQKYSHALKATFLDETGKPAPLEMGCYGIGISRIAAAAIEQNHDARGIIWPRPLAPFEVVICPIGMSHSETVRQHAQTLYTALQASGIDVILDDRDVRPGIMFAEWELIGVPLRVTLGERSLKNHTIELQARGETEATLVAPDEALTQIQAKLEML